MSDPAKTQPPFGSNAFAAAGTGNTSPALGQNTSGNQSASSNIFGQNFNPPAAPASGFFGSPTTAAGPGRASSVFGGGQTDGVKQGSPLFGGGQASGGFGAGNSSPLFGQASGAFGGGKSSPSFGATPPGSATSTGFTLGQTSAAAQQNATTATGFGGSSAPSQNAAGTFGQTQPSNAFGAASNVGGNSPFSNFGSNAASSAPAGSSTPQTNKSPFNIQSTTPAGPPPSQPGGLFGSQKPEQASANPFQAAIQQSTQRPASNLFGGGNTQSTPSNLFGAPKPENAPETSSTSPNLFGGQSSQQQSSNFFQNLTKVQDNGAATSGTSTSAAGASALLSPGIQQQGQDAAAKPPTFSIAQVCAQQTQQATDAKLSPFSFPSGNNQNTSTSNSGFSLGGRGTRKLADMPPLGSSSASTSDASNLQPADEPAFGFPSAPTSDANTLTADKPALSFPASSTSSAQPATTPATAAPSTGNMLAALTSTSMPTTTTTAPAFSLTPAASSEAPGATTAPPTSHSISATLGAIPAEPTSTSTFQPATTATAPATAAPLQQQQETAPTTTATAPLAASTAGPAPPATSRLKGKSMDEIITRWASDLSKHQKEFQEAANKVATWDRLLVENSDKISKLYSRCFQAERDTAEVERQLSTVEGQQDELSAWLDRYEMETERLMGDNVGRGMDGGALQGPDQERERTYKLAERLSDRLNDMGKDLTSMIEEINAASATLSKTSRPDDPLSQIVRVLNNHLHQLQTIDSGTADLQAKVAAAQKENQKMGGFGNGYGVLGSDAVDDFYKSYMRRG